MDYRRGLFGHLYVFQRVGDGCFAITCFRFLDYMSRVQGFRGVLQAYLGRGLAISIDSGSHYNACGDSAHPGSDLTHTYVHRSARGFHFLDLLNQFHFARFRGGVVTLGRVDSSHVDGCFIRCLVGQAQAVSVFRSGIFRVHHVMGRSVVAIFFGRRGDFFSYGELPFRHSVPLDSGSHRQVGGRGRRSVLRVSRTAIGAR